jgi:hypothetical protein
MLPGGDESAVAGSGPVSATGSEEESLLVKAGKDFSLFSLNTN